MRGFATVDRSISTDQDYRSASSVVQFVDAPNGAHTDQLLEVLGLTEARLVAGECRSLAAATSSTPFGGLDRVELLDAGEVDVRAGDQLNRLAPLAFPDVSGIASGVLYATRDRDKDSLPANVDYTVVTSQAPHVPPLSLTAPAPKDLQTVTVGGRPLTELSTINLSGPVDVTWDVGAEGDLVYVEFSTDTQAVACAFRDEVGAGSVGAEAVSALADAREIHLAIRRVRVVDYFGLEDVRLHGAQLRFNFELTRLLRTE